jgi:hypothetical protein
MAGALLIAGLWTPVAGVVEVVLLSIGNHTRLMPV